MEIYSNQFKKRTSEIWSKILDESLEIKKKEPLLNIIKGENDV